MPEMVWCEKKNAASEPDRPGSLNVLTGVTVEGFPGVSFVCWSKAHPGEPHSFKVGTTRLLIPWDKFRLVGPHFLDGDITLSEVE